MIKLIDFEPSIKPGMWAYELEEALKEFNDWLDKNKQEAQNMQLGPAPIKVISVETLYKDNSSYGGYQPKAVGLRVWYEQQ